MARKQMNIRLDELTRETIKRIAERWNMSESQVITRGVVLLEQELEAKPGRKATPRSDAENNAR